MESLRLFPLNCVFFPGATMSIHVFEERYRRLVSASLDEAAPFGIALVREGAEVGDPGVTPHAVGTEARIVRCKTIPDGRLLIDVHGERRFTIVRVRSREPYLVGEVEYLAEPRPGPAARELLERARAGLPAYVTLLARMANLDLAVPELPDDPVAASYVMAQALQTNDAAKQRLLEVGAADERLRVELAVLRRATAALERIASQRAAGAQSGAGGDPVRRGQERLFGVSFSAN